MPEAWRNVKGDPRGDMAIRYLLRGGMAPLAHFSPVGRNEKASHTAWRGLSKNYFGMYLAVRYRAKAQRLHFLIHESKFWKLAGWSPIKGKTTSSVLDQNVARNPKKTRAYQLECPRGNGAPAFSV
jgi:hypothetical protein